MIREIYDLPVEEQKAHAAIYGGYNDVPPNWKEVNAATIATECLVRMYTPKLTEHRQISHTQIKERHMLACTLFFFHDGTGYAVHYDYWQKRIRYFMFSRCEHTYGQVMRPAGNRSGIHTMACTKCGYVNSYDTSD